MPWFTRPSDGELYHIPNRYPDTIKRLRVEGWPEVEAPVATTESASVAAQVEVVTPASSPERAAPKRTPVKPKTVRKRTPVRRPSTTGRKVGQTS